MPSINHLAVNSRVQNHPTKPQASPARTVHFGMQPNVRQEPANQSQGCCSGLFSWFRNLFRRSQQPSPVPPEMQERAPLRPETQPTYQSHQERQPEVSRPLLRRQESGPVNLPTRSTEDSETPIHILAERHRARIDAEQTGLGIPFSPPDVSEAKWQRQKKYSNKV